MPGPALKAAILSPVAPSAAIEMIDFPFMICCCILFVEGDWYKKLTGSSARTESELIDGVASRLPCCSHNAT